ncbi:MAG: nicotinate-nucleotide adenylyltransferase [Anaerovoracaceae bacterium]|nr:nicotinate-nucleotide adenylyltransferase [Bacillota bacterium]MDY3954816.1 nicotinate-nucleotide adenylyltransferase [Anaerovoracaceae bacterium]
MKKIGIFGGTFDPIHIGHLILAEQAADAADLDSLLLMPAQISPFKIGKDVASPRERLEMVKLAVEGNPRLQASDLELQRKEISYTAVTLDLCREKFGKNAEISFVLGADAFLKIEQWREGPRILSEYCLIVGSRAGYLDEERDAQIAKLRERYHTKITVAFMPKIEISSTDIRKRIQEGRSLRYILPPGVEAYIRDRGLYDAERFKETD